MEQSQSPILPLGLSRHQNEPAIMLEKGETDAATI